MTYDPARRAEVPEAEILAVQQMHAIALRKLSILGGLITGLEHEGFLGLSRETLGDDYETAREWLLKRLYQIAESTFEEPLVPGQTPEKIMQGFQGMLLNLVKESGLPPVTKESFFQRDPLYKQYLKYPHGAEVWFLSEYNANQTLIFETVLPQGNTFQVDVPLANLPPPNEALRKEYEAILTGLQTNQFPVWFLALRPWEQGMIVKKLQQTPPDYQAFLQFKPAGMMHTPGLANARMNYLLLEDPSHPDRLDLVSRSVKTGIIDPHKIKYRKPHKIKYRKSEQEALGLTAKIVEEERKRLIKANADYLVEFLHEEVKRTRNPAPFRKDPPPLPLIFVQSLVTDLALASLVSDEPTMARNVLDVMKQISKDKKKDFTLIVSNDSVNATRHAQFSSDKAILRLMKYTDEFLKAGPNTEVYDIALIEATFYMLVRMRSDSTVSGRNFNLMRAAYAAILAEAMGGIVSTNCKSAKDRTELEEMMRHAIWLCCKRKNHTLPSYYETDPDKRKAFLEIYNEVYACLKTGETASMSAEGAFGAKDNFIKHLGILCRDIRKILGEQYEMLLHLAHLNKPGKKAPTKSHLTTKQYGIRGPLRQFETDAILQNNGTVATFQFVDTKEWSLTTRQFAQTLSLFAKAEFNTEAKINPDTKQLEFHFKYITLDSVDDTKLCHLAANRVQAFLASSSNPAVGIEIFGPMSPRLSRYIQAYCQVCHVPCTNSNPLVNVMATRETRDEMEKFLQKFPDTRLGVGRKPPLQTAVDTSEILSLTQTPTPRGMGRVS